MEDSSNKDGNKIENVSNSYNRLENEPDWEWEGFTIYRNLGPRRTFTAVAKRMDMTNGTIGDWARKYNWRERVKAWQAMIDKTTTRQDLLDQQAAQIRQLRQARLMQEAAEEQIEKYRELAEELEKPQLDLDKSSRVLTEAIKLERLIMGNPTEVTEQRQSQIDWSKLDAEEIQLIRVLLTKAKKEPIK